LDEVLSQDVVHIDDLLLLRDAWVALRILSSCVAHQPFYFIQTIFLCSFLSFLAGFDKKILHVCGDIMGCGSWESI
jgi:hypothetical protein